MGKGATSVHVLQIEYPVPDYGAWKAAFDRDLLDREGSGVRRYRVLRPTDDPNYVLIDLEFDEAERAEAYLAALQSQFYSSQDASPAVGGPQTRIAEVAEIKSTDPRASGWPPIHPSAWKGGSRNFAQRKFLDLAPTGDAPRWYALAPR
jgi:hypothetical protein